MLVTFGMDLFHDGHSSVHVSNHSGVQNTLHGEGLLKQMLSKLSELGTSMNFKFLKSG